MNTSRKALIFIFSFFILAGAAAAFLNLGPLFRDESGRPTAQVATPREDGENEEPAPVLLIPEADLPDPLEEQPVDDLPVGKLVLTKDRKQYEDMSLTLQIPALNLTCPVYDGTDADTLGKMGAGLYAYAQMPGPGNRNTSMAGHRNTRRNGIITDKAPFYYIDLLQEGDYIYLFDDTSIYRYLWDFTEILEQDDWDMIRTTGYSCVTITSCHPIGISDHRIVARGLLDAILPYSEAYPFPASSL